MPGSERRRYRTPAEIARVTFPQMARELEMTDTELRRALSRAARLGLYVPQIRPGRDKHQHTYDAVLIEVIKAMTGVPYRQPPHPGDWLTRYEGEAPHARPEPGTSDDPRSPTPGDR
ncbi:MAG TPA: hypothetical protein VIT65_23230 [Microlunatus sp.]